MAGAGKKNNVLYPGIVYKYYCMNLLSREREIERENRDLKFWSKSITDFFTLSDLVLLLCGPLLVL